MDAKIRVIAYCTILILALAICVSNIKALPQMPHRFYGSVTLAGMPAPNGTLVEATINNITYASTATLNGKYGYAEPFNVPADDPDTPEIEGGKSGDTIDFYVAKTYATSCTFTYGSLTELNLTIAAPTPPIITLISPTTSSPIYTQQGKTIQITIKYTETNPLNRTIKIYNASYTIIQLTNETAITPGINITLPADITIPEMAPEGKYDLNITLYNIYNRSATATQANAIIIDNSPPSISSPYQEPPGQTIQPDQTVNVDQGLNVTIRVNVTDAMSNVKEVIVSYNVTATQWANITMQKTTGNEYTATIPLSHLTQGTTVNYYITARDNANNSASTPTNGIYFRYNVIPEFAHMLVIWLIISAITTIIAAIKRKNILPR